MSLESYRESERRCQRIALGALSSPFIYQKRKLDSELADMRDGQPDWMDVRYLFYGMMLAFTPLISEGDRLRKRLNAEGVTAGEALRGKAKGESGERLRAEVSALISKAGGTEGRTAGIQRINGWSFVKAEEDRHGHILLLQRELGATPEETEALFAVKRPKKGDSDYERQRIFFGHVESPFPEVPPKGDLFVISTHAECSGRCFPDQGKLVSKSMEAKNGLMTGEYDNGTPIWSLKAMLARTDQWGYHNFILSGFNCRHHLYPYEGKMPKGFPKEESERAYAADQRMRLLERRLRRERSVAEAWAMFDKAEAKKYFDRWEAHMRLYAEYAESHGTEAHPEWCE